MSPNSGARRLAREKVAAAANSTSHCVKHASARMRTCAAPGPCVRGSAPTHVQMPHCDSHAGAVTQLKDGIAVEG